jgi:hypothetical protein
MRRINMAGNRSSPLSLAAAVASVAVFLCLGPHQVMADYVLNTGSASYTAGYFENPTILGWTNNAQVRAFMAANGATFGSFTAATGPVASNFSPVTVGPGFPIGAWFANGPNSSWIGPTANGAAGAVGTPATLASFVNTGAGYDPATSSPQGFFAYTTTFALSGPPTSLTGLQWASDNQGVAIYLNGKNEGFVNPGDFTKFTPFGLNTADFVVGTNSLTFVVFNEEFGSAHFSPTGVRIEGIIGIPEPWSLTLAASALPIFGLVWARRRRA